MSPSTDLEAVLVEIKRLKGAARQSLCEDAEKSDRMDDWRRELNQRIACLAATLEQPS